MRAPTATLRGAALALLSLGVVLANDVAVAAAAAPRRSQQSLQPTFSTGVTYSDNIARTTGGGSSEALVTAAAGATIVRNQNQLLLAAQLDAIAYKYVEGFAEDELLPRADVVLVYDVLPERFRWIAEDLFGQIASRGFREISPSTRQNNNYFSTGPELRQPLGSSLVLHAAARWADSYYEKSDIDSRRVIGQLALEYPLDARRGVSLNVYRSATSFKDETVSPDLGISTAFVRYEAALRRTSIALQAGGAETDDGRGNTRREPVLLADLSLRFGAYSSVQAGWYRGFQDATDAFRYGEQRLGTRADIDENVLAVADTFLADQHTVALTIDRPKVGVRLIARRATEEYQVSRSFDRERLGVGAEARYALGPRTTIRAFAAYEREEAADFGESSLSSLGFELDYRVARRFGLAFAAEHYRQRDPVNQPDETRIAVELRYPVLRNDFEHEPASTRRRGTELFRRAGAEERLPGGLGTQPRRPVPTQRPSDNED